MTPSFDIVIAAFNAPHWVTACLETVRRYSEGPYRVHVVADGCDEWVVGRLSDKLAELWPDESCTFQVNTVNEGYLRSVNKGILAGENEYVICLNSDTLVTPRWLQGIDAALTSGPRVGVVCPLASWANFTRVGFPAGATFLEVADLVRSISPRRYPEIGFASGFCFAGRRELFEELAGFDTSYGPGYFEESDFCMRASERGWRVVADDATFIFHYGWASFGKTHRDGWMERNRMRFERRWGRAHEMWHERAEAADHWNWLTEAMLERFGSDGVRIKGNRTRAGASLDSSAGDATPHRQVLFLISDLALRQETIAVLQLANRLVLGGMHAQVATYGTTPDEIYREQLFLRPYVFDDREALIEALPAFQTVIATDSATVEDATDLAARWGARAVALTQGSEAAGNGHSPDIEIARVPPGVNHDVFYPGSPRPKEPIQIMVPVEDGVDTAGISAALTSLRPDLQVLVASGSVEKGGPRVRRVPRLPQVRYAGLLRSCAALVDLWGDQAAGRAGLEGMASGVPAILGRGPGGIDYADEGVNCLQFEAGDADAAARLVARLLDDTDLAERLRSGGHLTAECFGVAAEADALRQVLAEDVRVGARAPARGAA